MTGEDRRVVEGFKLPSYAPPTENELGWISMLRTIVGDSDPRPTLAAVQGVEGGADAVKNAAGGRLGGILDTKDGKRTSLNTCGTAVLG